MTHEEFSNYSLRWFKYNPRNSIQLPILKNLKKRVEITKRSKVLIIAHGVDKYHIMFYGLLLEKKIFFKEN